jgi:hypothetical protein
MIETAEANVRRRLALSEEKTARAWERFNCRIANLERMVREMRAQMKTLLEEKEHGQAQD